MLFQGFESGEASMSVADEYTATSGPNIGHAVPGDLGGRLLAALRMLLAGMHASKEYRHLNAMTDQQLRTLGLSRGHIEQEIHRRHLAAFSGTLRSPD
jgi:uncharacterized protein YjiS (DUF1127 family)